MRIKNLSKILSFIRAPPSLSVFFIYKKGDKVMSYDRIKEYKKWLNDKKKEEITLRNKGVNEKFIVALRIMDKDMFNQERNFKRYESITQDIFFNLQTSTYNFKEITTLDDLLSEIQNESLYDVVYNTDPITKRIIELKYQGYTVKEISKLIDLDIYVIYKKIRNLRKKIEI